jgi:hypothetical protein
MKRRFQYSLSEVMIAVGFVGLLGYTLYPEVTHAMFSFLHGLPWNP